MAQFTLHPDYSKVCEGCDVRKPTRNPGVMYEIKWNNGRRSMHICRDCIRDLIETLSNVLGNPD